MDKNRLFEISVRLHSLAVFRSILSDGVIAKLSKYLSAVGNSTLTEAVDAYSDFVSELMCSREINLSRHIRSAVYDSENVYVCRLAQGEEISAQLKKCVDEEIQILQDLADLSPADLRSGLAWEGFLPEFETHKIDLKSDYEHRIANIGKYGYGMYSHFYMFRIDEHKQIVPVYNPDKTRLADLIDYKAEQQIIIDNTRALLQGRPAANILLTGDAGTGKSSTVKAVVNELRDEGLRIIEVRKEQLREIPAILDHLSNNPLKFILFIDDLSFQKDDDNFSALKAILEGSVSAKSSNVVIYATSNRRHLVKETFSGREGDEVHLNDTMQEIVSLSERFGIHITFQRPDKKTYLDIVHHLADEKGIEYDAAELDILAERFVLGRSTRSARAARQFVDGLVANKDN